MTKQCSKCGKIKNIDEFYLSKRYTDGHISQCKDCKRKTSRTWKKNNPKKVKANWRKWAEDNVNKLKEKSRIRYYNDPEKARNRVRQWRKNNPDKRKAQKKRWKNKRLQRDPNFKLRRRVSSIIQLRLKNRSSSKNGRSTFDFLPYTLGELKQHLENQFQPDMTWQNYGQWHIDHIKPDSSFSYTSVEDKEFQECWALKNLQPLWAKDNLKKSNKIYVNV